MPIDHDLLRKALEHIAIDEEGNIYRHGLYEDLSSDLNVWCARNRTTEPAKSELYTYHSFISQDLWNIETLLERLDWQRGLWVSGQLDEAAVGRFTSADVDLFHVEFRSIFDYVAAAVSALAPKPGQVPTSFNDLGNWVVKNGNRIGTELAGFVSKGAWYGTLRTVRDANVHRGAHTTSFQVKPRILFQTFNRGFAKLIDMPEVMYNENVVDFEPYAGMFYGYLLAYLEDMAEVVYSRLSIPKRPEPRMARSFHFGIAIGKAWIGKALSLPPATAAPPIT